MQPRCGKKELTPDDRKEIVNLAKNSNLKRKDIAERYNINPKTIPKIIKKYSTSPTFESKPRKGRPTKYEGVVQRRPRKKQQIQSDTITFDCPHDIPYITSNLRYGKRQPKLCGTPYNYIGLVS